LGYFDVERKMLIDTKLLNALTAQAKASPRLRMNLDLRNTPEDQSQRMLNALEPGTVMPIHRHRHTSETVVVLRGKVKWLYYNDKGELTETILVEAGGDICGLSVPMGQWHSIECLESGSVILETKDGAWEAMREEDVLQ
jgi:cupin fold WbuC family metalloprotein